MKQKLQQAAVLVLLCFVLLFAYVTFLHLLIDPFFAQRKARRLLATASTPQELLQVVGPLGAFYTFPDGSWLAIHYRDSHAGGVWSVAVARDSGGHWYQSREHFCGAFSAVRHLQEFSAAVGEPTWTPSDAHSQWIQQLAASPDLQTARQQLSSRYFTPLR